MGSWLIVHTFLSYTLYVCADDIPMEYYICVSVYEKYMALFLLLLWVNVLEGNPKI